MDFLDLRREGKLGVLLDFHEDLSNRHIERCKVIFFKCLARFKVYCVLHFRIFLLLLILGDLRDRELRLLGSYDSSRRLFLVYELFHFVHKFQQGVSLPPSQLCHQRSVSPYTLIQSCLHCLFHGVLHGERPGKLPYLAYRT